MLIDVIKVPTAEQPGVVPSYGTKHVGACQAQWVLHSIKFELRLEHGHLLGRDPQGPSSHTPLISINASPSSVCLDIPAMPSGWVQALKWLPSIYWSFVLGAGVLGPAGRQTRPKGNDLRSRDRAE